MRSVAGVIGGIVAWIVVATIGNLAVRALLSGYADAEQTMAFALDMQIARLVIGALASFGAGWVAARITLGAPRVVWCLTLLLIVLFVPVHYWLWDRFPLWYHLAFFATLLVATPAGGGLVRRGGAR